MLKKLFLLFLLSIHNTIYALDNGVYIGTQGGFGRLYDKNSHPISGTQWGLFAKESFEPINIIRAWHIRYQHSPKIAITVTPYVKFSQYNYIQTDSNHQKIKTIKYEVPRIRDAVVNYKIYDIGKKLKGYGQIGIWSARSPVVIQYENPIEQRSQRQILLKSYGFVLGGGVNWEFTPNCLLSFSYKRFLVSPKVLLDLLGFTNRMQSTHTLGVEFSYRIL